MRLAHALIGEVTIVATTQVPVGTTERIAGMIAKTNPSVRAAVAYVPEFLRLGNAIETFLLADRFVIGADDRAIAERVAAIYRPLGRPIILTSPRTAEMAKHASNAFLAMSISAINEVADLCERSGADVVQVAEIMKLDRRIGRHAYLSPGLGFAGGTLGRDVRALQALGRTHHCETRLLDSAMSVNATRARVVGGRLQEMFGALDGLAVAILGLTYKTGASTLRRSVAIEIIDDLIGRGVTVKVFDPLARLEVTDIRSPFEVCTDPYAAAAGCDAVVLITPWRGIEALNLPQLRAVMRRPVFLDTRNQFDPTEMRDAGFLYSGIGRGSIASARS
jgi:UDPglucose 6-dehydrogenase